MLMLAEIFFLHQIQHEVIADFGIVAHALLDADIAFQQLNDGTPPLIDKKTQRMTNLSKSGSLCCATAQQG